MKFCQLLADILHNYEKNTLSGLCKGFHVVNWMIIYCMLLYFVVWKHYFVDHIFFLKCFFQFTVWLND